MSELLSQTDVRNRFSEITEGLRRRVFSEIHFGFRGQDELVILRSADLRELKRLAQKGAAAEASAGKATRANANDPWAGLKSALKANPKLGRPEERQRCLPRDVEASEPEAPSWGLMVQRAGAGPAKPKFTRRRAPR